MQLSFQTKRRRTSSWAGHDTQSYRKQGATYTFAGQASMQTDRTVWKTLCGNRAANILFPNDIAIAPPTTP